MRMVCVPIVLALLGAGCASNHGGKGGSSGKSSGGKLGGFERSATGGGGGSSSSGGGSHHAGSGRHGCGHGLFEALFSGSGGTGGGGDAKVDWFGEREMEAVRSRISGSPMIPAARVDVTYQWVDSDVRALSYTVELGRGLFAAEFRHTHYTEDTPGDALYIYQIHGLRRMPARF